jgi:hypothetical protein
VNGNICPFNELIWVTAKDSTNTSLTIISCIFNGLGAEGNSIYHLIGSEFIKKMILKDSLF